MRAISLFFHAGKGRGIYSGQGMKRPDNFQNELASKGLGKIKESILPSYFFIWPISDIIDKNEDFKGVNYDCFNRSGSRRRDTNEVGPTQGIASNCR